MEYFCQSDRVLTAVNGERGEGAMGSSLMQQTAGDVELSPKETLVASPLDS